MNGGCIDEVLLYLQFLHGSSTYVGSRMFAYLIVTCSV